MSNRGRRTPPRWRRRPGDGRRGTTGAGAAAGGAVPRPPSAHPLRPCTNTGTSAPSSSPRAASARSSSLASQIRLSATRVVAAFELPPPSPAPGGTRLTRRIDTPLGAAARARAWARSRWAARTESSFPALSPGGGSRSTMRSSRRGISSTSSPKSRSWKTVWRSCRPSARRPRMRRNRLSFAGAGQRIGGRAAPSPPGRGSIGRSARAPRPGVSADAPPIPRPGEARPETCARHVVRRVRISRCASRGSRPGPRPLRPAG